MQNWQNLPPMSSNVLPYYPVVPPTGHHVSPKRLEEFRRIYKEACGEEITSAEASAMIHPLLALYKLLLQPLSVNEIPSFSPSPAQSAAGEGLIFLKVCWPSSVCA